MRAEPAAFRAWCRTLAGCSGGDWGSPARPAIWVCGIEPGGPQARTAVELAAALRHDHVSTRPRGYADWRANLAHGFTRRIVKLLTALAGGEVAGYRDFARERQPFTRGARGYCRLNLYPVGFADTSAGRWSAGHARLTGFATKRDYLAWCDAQRLPRLRRLAHRCQPRLVIGLGKTWHAAFAAAFLDPGSAFAQEVVASKPLLHARNRDGTLVTVLPFLTSPSGLQSDASLQAAGKRLRSLLAAPPDSGSPGG